jgi:DNA segregation ATPase FtsK/SpoIIIE-like protein
MARGPRRKQRITYDSNETKTVFGLLFLFIGILTLLSLFMDAPIFKFFKDIFSNDFATFCFSLFLFDLSLAMFRSKFPFAQGKSLIGQAIFLLAYSAFLNSIWGTNYKLVNSPVDYGGVVGYYIYTFLSENIFMNFTPIFILCLIFISIPLTFSITILAFLEKIGSILEKIVNIVRKRMGKKPLGVDETLLLEPAEPGLRTVGQLTGKGKIPRPEIKAPVLSQEQSQEDLDLQEQAMKTVGALSQKTVMPQPVDRSGDPYVVKEESKGGATINETLKYANWVLPSVDLLNSFRKRKPSQENIKKNADVIEETLESFGIRAKVVDVLIGPSVTQYALDLPLGIKVAKIVNLSKDLAMSLAIPANSIRLETPIPGTSFVGIEVPNEERETVYLKEAMADLKEHYTKLILPAAVGKDIHGNMIVIDLQKMPHILVAGATGSGKSILTNGFIVSLLMTKTPDEVKFIMVDPKQVELSDYNGIAHLLTPVITDMDKVLNALKWAIAEMESRYTLFRESHVKNCEAYNALMGYHALPYIVIVIDEMADMMMSTNRVETESAIVRLAQKARATGIHLVLATQRPSVDVITGLIKANIPGRIGMSVTTNIDSRVILDQIGAESLLGKGDMLFKDPAKNKPFRIQGIWVSPEETQRVVEYIKKQVPEVEYTTKVTEFKTEKDLAKENKEGMVGTAVDDEKFANAVRAIVNAQKGSASLLQRKLGLGYNKAARFLDEMEEMGVVGPSNGSKPREVYIQDAEDFLQQLSSNATAAPQPAAEPQNPPVQESAPVAP